MSEKLSKLKELKELLDSGAINQADFEQLKKEAFSEEGVNETSNEPPNSENKPISSSIDVEPAKVTSQNSRVSGQKKPSTAKKVILIIGLIFLVIIIAFALAEQGGNSPLIEDFLNRSDKNWCDPDGDGVGIPHLIYDGTSCVPEEGYEWVSDGYDDYRVKKTN